MPNREPRNNLQEKGCVEQQSGVYEQHDQQEQRGVGETFLLINKFNFIIKYQVVLVL